MHVNHDKIAALVEKLDKAELAKRFEHAIAAINFTHMNARNYDNPKDAAGLERLMLAALKDAMEEPAVTVQ